MCPRYSGRWSKSTSTTRGTRPSMRWRLPRRVLRPLCHLLQTRSPPELQKPPKDVWLALTTWWPAPPWRKRRRLEIVVGVRGEKMGWLCFFSLSLSHQKKKKGPFDVESLTQQKRQKWEWVITLSLYRSLASSTHVLRPSKYVCSESSSELCEAGKLNRSSLQASSLCRRQSVRQIKMAKSAHRLKVAQQRPITRPFTPSPTGKASTRAIGNPTA